MSKFFKLLLWGLAIICQTQAADFSVGDEYQWHMMYYGDFSLQKQKSIRKDFVMVMQWITELEEKGLSCKELESFFTEYPGIKEGMLFGVRIEKGLSFSNSCVWRRKIIHPLLFAIRKEEPKLVEFLLIHGFNPNQFISNSFTFLDFAVEHGNEEIVALLVQHGAVVTPYSMNRSEWLSQKIGTLLHDAYTFDIDIDDHKGLTIRETIIPTKGVAFSEHDQELFFTLFGAINSDALDILLESLEAMENKELINQWRRKVKISIDGDVEMITSTGETLLSYAIKKRKFEAFKMLFDFGVNVNEILVPARKSFSLLMRNRALIHALNAYAAGDRRFLYFLLTQDITIGFREMEYVHAVITDQEDLEHMQERYKHQLAMSHCVDGFAQISLEGRKRKYHDASDIDEAFKKMKFEE